MNTLFFSWGKRNLTILGKIMIIIKALVIPIFTFVVSACVDKYRKENESKCFKFIWDGKPDKVKRNTMIGNFEMGGLNMIDIGSYRENVLILFRKALSLYLNQLYARLLIY
jgi:hypothetical protein